MRLRRRSRKAQETTLSRRDILLIDAVLADECTPEQESEFDRRYVEEDAFHMIAGPLLELRIQLIDWERLEARIVAEEKEKKENSTLYFVQTQLATGLGMAVIIAILTIGATTAIMLADLSRRHRQDPDFAAGAKPANTPAAAPGTQPSRAPGTATRAPAGAATTVADAGASSAAVRAPAHVPDGKPLSWQMFQWLGTNGRALASNADSSNSVVLPDSSRVILRPGSSIRYSSAPLGIPGAIVELRNGELSVLVTSHASVVTVITRAGVAKLLAGTGPGAFAVRCSPKPGTCDVLELTVAHGRAELVPDRSGATGALFGDGRFARIRRDEMPAPVPASAARGFPVVDAGFASMGKQP